MGCIVGLGNPGRQYERTRHNFGFMAVDALLDAVSRGRIPGASCERLKECKEYALWRCRLGLPGPAQLVLKPLTFMNLSGNAVSQVCTFYKIEPANILVVHDELDLPLGRMKLKVGGGTAGHNGLKSIAERMGSKDFVRLRMGIGKPERGDTTGWVLGGFAPSETAVAREVIDAACDGIVDWLERPLAEAMERVNGFRAPSAQPADTGEENGQ